MGKHLSVIEVNGKRYDTVTGKLIDQKIQANQPKLSEIHNHHSGSTIDGFIRSNMPHSTPNINTATINKLPAHHAHQVHANRVSGTTTLMRTAVAKPRLPVAKTPEVKANSGTTHRITPQSQSLNHERLERAHSQSTHHKVSRFGAGAHHTEKQEDDSYPSTHVAVAVPSGAPAVSLPILPSLVTSASHAKLQQLINNAMLNADSQVQKPLKKRLHRRKYATTRARFATLASGTVACIALVGFFAMQNIPNVSMRVAASRSGVPATLPGYKPDGFAFSGPILFDKQRVIVRFAISSDPAQSYNITQRRSTWNSEALLNDFVSKGGRSYQILQDKGKTIFIYDGHKATWVDSGLWYNVEGSVKLSSDQLLKLSSSM